MANKPNNPSLWSRAKSLAKQKFDVYPSAYANGWAAKWYKGKGGTWSKAEYGMEIPMMENGGKPDWLLEAQLKAQGYFGNALQQKINSMAQGGEPQNAGFQALPQYVQDKIMGAAYGGYIPEMGYGGIALQDVIDRLQKREEKLVAKGYKAVDEGRDKKADRILGRAARVEDRKIRLMENMAYGGMAYPFMDEGGEANGEMALGQMAAVSDKMAKLLQFVKPDDNLDPWVASKLAVMDHSADAISDYMMYGAEGDEEETEEMEDLDEMANGGYTVTRSNDRKGKTHKVTGPDGTVKYFGDSKLGQHPKDPKRKAAFYARHKKNLDNNPFFRAFARETWAEGGYVGYDGKRHMSNTPTWSGNTGYEMGGMMYGNPFLPMAQYGMETEPRQEDYPDYQSWEQAMLDWTYGRTNEQPVATAAPSAPEVIEGDVPGGGQRPLPPELIPQSAPTYSGPSIVDMLASVGKASDFNSRTKLAEQLGISNYRGTASQNISMMKKIMNNPTVLNDYNPPVNTSRKSSSAQVNVPTAPDANEADQGTDQPKTSTQAPVKKEAPKTSGSNVGRNVGIGLGIAGALGVAGLTAADLIGADFEKLSSKDAFKGIDKRRLTLARKKLIDEAFKAGVKSIDDAEKFYKKLPSRARKILDNLDAMEIPNSLAGTKGVAAQDVAAYNALQEAQAEEAIIAQREAAKKAADLRRFNAQKAAAIRWGKPIPTMPTAVAPAAAEARSARGIWNVIREGYGAARATPLFKLLRKEDGGYIPYMQEGGDSTFENFLEFIDPTGVSSYDDVYRTFNDANAPWWEKTLSVASALPVVGKLGKGAKAFSELSKIGKAKRVAGKIISPVAQMDNYLNPASRFVGTVTGKALENAPKGVKIAADIGSKSNQARRFFTGTDMLMGYAQGGIYIDPKKKGTFKAQATRMGMGVQEAASAILNAPEGKYSPEMRRKANFARNFAKQDGGLVEGAEMEVTPEQAELLRQQGYDFEII